MFPKQIHEDFMETLGNKSPFYSTLPKWAAEFKTGGGGGVWDDGQSCRPKNATTDVNVKGVRTLVICDRR